MIDLDLLGGSIGLVTAVVAAMLLWPIGARLGLDPASRAATAALYAAAVAGVELYAPGGVDGLGTMLLAIGACLAVGSLRRDVIAALVTAAAMIVSPVTGVGFLALLGGMTLTGALAKRLGTRFRFVLALGFGVAAVALAALLVRPDLPLALPPVALGMFTLWALLVISLLWRRMRWLRSLGAALLAMLACCWLPGPDADAVIVVAAVGGVLTAVFAAEFPRLILRRVVVVGIAALAVAAAVLTPGDARRIPGPGGAGPTGSGAAVSGLANAAAITEPGAPAAPVRPVRITIPALGLAGPLETLTADPGTGELEAPDDPSKAGWYAAGVIPGDAGPAVVGGHVDSRAGPGVFYGLRELRPGDEIEIVRSDGRTVRFAVTTVGRYPKTEFPTAAVYGPAPGPELRLVTCGGKFDRTERSYRDNVVVGAVLT